MTAAGRNANRMPSTKRRAPASLGSAIKRCQQPAEVDRQNGQDGPELDQHLERLARRLEAEKVPRKQHMPVDDTGMNSVSPSSSPRNMTCQ